MPASITKKLFLTRRCEVKPIVEGVVIAVGALSIYIILIMIGG